MRIGFVGMGKLGWPVAMAYATKHDVVGYDISPHAKEILISRKYPHREEGAQELLETTTLRVVDSIDDVVKHADLCFVAVQTPHGPLYEGITRMPETREDFSYVALKQAVSDVAKSAKQQQKHVTVVVVSTVLPGTSEREIMPLLINNSYVSYVYSPKFIAMSSVIADELHPEFVLLGIDKSDARGVEEIRAFVESFHPAEKLRFMSVASAELAKVAYNVYLGLKIVAANAVMEIAHKTGADCDAVTDALAKATDRVVSSKYMRGGMGDGGGCHSRDAIALSWLAQELCLSYDLFDAMIGAREEQTAWLAELCVEACNEGEKTIVILGKAYKKGTNLTVGSPAVLLKNILDNEYDVSVEQWDPHVDDEIRIFDKPAVFIIGTNHDEFYDDNMVYPKGSTVIDPWGKMKDREGVKVVRVGRR